MNKAGMRVVRWAALATLTAALAACGGGGGDGSAEPLPAPRDDVRNGSYVLVAADAREYTLTLDFDDLSYRLVGTGVDQAGSFTASGDAFAFQPGNAIGATGVSTTRFFQFDDAVVGEVALPGGAVPFIAAREFQSTVAGAAGTYNFLGRTVDTGGAPVNTTIQQAEITSNGTLRICEDLTIYRIQDCPAGSVTTGTLTVSEGVFTATTPAGAFPFRVANIGGSKVFLRASASSTSTRRFIVGMPATDSFATGSFTGGTTEPAWSTFRFDAASFTSTGTLPNGVATNLAGNATPQATGNSLASLVRINTTVAGNFFAIRSPEIAMVLAARDNPVAPGYAAIGRRQ